MSFSTAILSLVPVVSAASSFAPEVPPISSAMASAAAFFSLSVSSILISLPPTRSLLSFSSSLSPRLKGSLSVSPMGFGSTVDSGCHLLALLDELLGVLPESLAPSLGEVLYRSLLGS